MIKEILKYPDETLRFTSEEVTNFTVIHKLLDDMADTIEDSDVAVAMAAIQIGVPLRVIVIKFKDMHIEAINPKIIESSGEQHLVEACLSLPGILSPVDRKSHIVVQYQDREGEVKTERVTGIGASIWQHELEHLDGGLYIDSLSRQKKKKVMARYEKSLK